MFTNSVDKVYIRASTVKKEAAKADWAVDGQSARVFGERLEIAPAAS
jgi:hypothetical protein